MMHFKIKSLTNTLGKRDSSKDLEIKFTYSSGVKKQTSVLPAGGEMIISCEKLPVEIQKYRMKNLLTVQEVKKPSDYNDFSAKLKTTSNKKKEKEVEIKPTTTVKPKTTKTSTSSTKKKTSSKTKSTTTTTTTTTEKPEND